MPTRPWFFNDSALGCLGFISIWSCGAGKEEEEGFGVGVSVGNNTYRWGWVKAGSIQMTRMERFLLVEPLLCSLGTQEMTAETRSPNLPVFYRMWPHGHSYITSLTPQRAHRRPDRPIRHGFSLLSIYKCQCIFPSRASSTHLIRACTSSVLSLCPLWGPRKHKEIASTANTHGLLSYAGYFCWALHSRLISVSEQHIESGFVIISILQMGKLRFGEIKYLPSAKQGLEKPRWSGPSLPFIPVPFMALLPDFWLLFQVCRWHVLTIPRGLRWKTLRRGIPWRTRG